MMTERNDELEKPMTWFELKTAAAALRWYADLENNKGGVLHQEILKLSAKLEYRGNLLKDGVVCP